MAVAPLLGCVVMVVRCICCCSGCLCRVIMRFVVRVLVAGGDRRWAARRRLSVLVVVRMVVARVIVHRWGWRRGVPGQCRGGLRACRRQQGQAGQSEQ
jgi:hypothetical protein